MIQNILPITLPRIVSYLDSNPDVAVVSGNYTKHKPEMPHGAGRYIRNSFFEKTRWNGSYPEQMGYESAILYEAEYLGYKYAVIEEAKYRHTRPLGLNHRFFEFGASMHTLGYHPMYALGRFAKSFFNRDCNRATWLVIYDLLLSYI